jgi:hypothetical protein
MHHGSFAAVPPVIGGFAAPVARKEWMCRQLAEYVGIFRPVWACAVTDESSFRRILAADARLVHRLVGRKQVRIVMGRPFFALLLVVALVFGATQASALLFWLMGPWTAVGIEHDGSATHMAFGQNLPRPAWIPVYPGATIVQASVLTSAQMPSGFGTLQIGTRAESGCDY